MALLILRVQRLNFRVSSSLFQRRFTAISGQSQFHFRAMSEQCQSNLRAVSEQFQSSFRATLGQFLLPWCGEWRWEGAKWRSCSSAADLVNFSYRSEWVPSEWVRRRPSWYHFWHPLGRHPLVWWRPVPRRWRWVASGSAGTGGRSPPVCYVANFRVTFFIHRSIIEL